MSDFILTNLEQVPGRKISAHFGLVQGNTVRAKHIGRDIASGLKNIVGGELHAYTELLTDSRQQALDRMVENCQSDGCKCGYKYTLLDLFCQRRGLRTLCLWHSGTC